MQPPDYRKKRTPLPNSYDAVDLRQPIPRPVQLFCGLYLAAAMGLFAVLFVPYGVGAEGTSSPIFLGSWAAAYGLTWILVVKYRVRFYSKDWPVLALCGLAMLSFIWSDNPWRTVPYGLAFVSNVAFAMLLRRFYSLDDFLNLLLKVILLMSISGAILSFAGFQPARYIDVHDRATLIGTEPIRGLSNHKITAGLYASIGFLLSFSLLRSVKRLAACSALFVFILLTGSSSSFAILLVGMMILFAMKTLGQRMSPAAFFAVAGFIAVFLGVFLTNDPESLLTLLGRDATLTGRTQLWRWGLEVASQKPMLGWGFLGYMGSDEALAYARTIPGFSTYEAPHFHNSYVQMFAELGMLGLLLCLALIGRTIYFLYTNTPRTRSPASTLMCAIIMLLGFTAMVVHVFFKYNDLPSLLIVYACLTAARVASPRKTKWSQQQVTTQRAAG